MSLSRDTYKPKGEIPNQDSPPIEGLRTHLLGLSLQDENQKKITDTVQQGKGLKRSNAVRRPSADRRPSLPGAVGGDSCLEMSSSPTDSASSRDFDPPRSYRQGSTDSSLESLVPSRELPMKISYTKQDLELPDILHNMVDHGESCATIGEWLVRTLQGTDSFYSGLIKTLVKANKPYYEICVRMMRALDLKTEEGHPLHSEAPMGGSPKLRPQPDQDIKRCVVDGPDVIAPSHTLCPVLGQRVQFPFEYDDQDGESAEVGEARWVSFAKHRVHIVEQSSPPRSVHVENDSL
ncbi:hypothetical protein BDV18DRAFT_4055 [Aspergillus unguis]